jgi:DNA primase
VTTFSPNMSDRDRVLESTDLVALVGEHVALKPKGREHVGLCPFHDDRSPSMAVVTHKGNAFYKCFACGAAGNAIDFVMEFHKMSFPEALRHLAARAGIALRNIREDGPKDPASSREALRAAMAAANRFYRKCYAEERLGAVARAHVERRELPAAAVEQFELGASPDGWDHLVKHVERLVAHAASGGEALHRESFEALGLIRPGQRGPIDGFRGRLMFPIHDELGNCIAFGARALKDGDEPKYLNSPDSPLFSKGRTLYALHHARRAIIETRHALIVEGYVDALALHAAGVRNVVATLGTALTKEHARTLQRMAERITLVFDPDAAGERAADRAVETFLAVPIDVRIAKLPDGLDADELLARENGRAEFDAAIEAGEDALAWMVRRFRADLRSADGMSGRQQRLQALLQKLGELGFRSVDPLRRRFVLNALSEMVQVPAETLERSMPQQRTATPMTVATAEPEIAPETAPEPAGPRHRARFAAERNFLAAVLGLDDRDSARVNLPDAGALPLAEAFNETHFDHPDHRSLWTLLSARLESGKPFRVQDIVADASVPTLKLLAGELYETGSRRAESADALQLVQTAAADLDRTLRLSAETPLPPGKALDATTLQELVERRRREGHRPGAIARAVRGDARNATAGPGPAYSPRMEHTP